MLNIQMRSLRRIINSMRLVLLPTLFCLQLTIASGEDSRCPTIRRQNGTRSNVAALILARGGSKGIPLKNLVEIEGKSLLTRTLETLLKFNRFSSIWVSTDDSRISDAVASGFHPDQVRIHIRPPEVAQDHTTSIESTQEFLQKHPEVDGDVALVQCTSPFLSVEYLEDALGLFQAAPDVDCVFSVVRSYKLRWRRLTDDRVMALNFDPLRRPRRQDWDGELVEAGMFYFARRKLLLEGRFQNENCKVVEIRGRDSLEIDTEYDLEIARGVMKRS